MIHTPYVCESHIVPAKRIVSCPQKTISFQLDFYQSPAERRHKGHQAQPQAHNHTPQAHTSVIELQSCTHELARTGPHSEVSMPRATRT